MMVSMLTTKNLVFICHHTVDPLLNPFIHNRLSGSVTYNLALRKSFHSYELSFLIFKMAITNVYLKDRM